MTLFTPASRNGLRTLHKPLLALALIGAIAFGAGAFAHSPVDAHTAQTGAQNAPGIVTHINSMLQIVYAEVGATDAQKAQLATITQQARTDLAQIEKQGEEGHARVFALLTRPTIDRGAVEAEYAGHMKNHEQVSRRTLQFLLDVAEALTPAQRKVLTDRTEQHAGHTG